MNDARCIAFLQWALPRMQMRWPGFRKVRRQVCRRIRRRLGDLGLSGLDDYRRYLLDHPEEWAVLDALTPVTISRFYRDKAVWDFLRREVLPPLGEQCDFPLRAWSAGCASGEEPYTLTMAWRFDVGRRRPDGALRVVATDVHESVLKRAEAACYAAGSLKLLPMGWLDRAFREHREEYCLRPVFREGVEFRRQDIRTALPEEEFGLIFCRNLVFTYYDAALQCRLLEGLLTRMHPGGALVIGRRESLPADPPDLEYWPGGDALGIYRMKKRR